MAHLWVREPVGTWAVMPLRPGLWDLTREPPGCLQDPGRLVAERGSDEVGLFCRTGSWTLLSGHDAPVRVNGERVVSGLRSLRDRDEIRIGSSRMFFSLETLACVDDFPGADSPLFCPRCRQQIQEGNEAVRCPRCGVWHHQSSELPCWTYSATCALCDQPSSFDAGFHWTPEEL
jgi:hypothetical protein